MYNVYLVGGATRDIHLGIPRDKIKDYDFAVEAPDFDSMVEYLRTLDAHIFEEKPQYGTLRARVPGFNLGCDFVMTRKDGPYGSDRRRPDSTKPGTILDDLARRDCTCNAIAEKVILAPGKFEFTGEFLDPHGGIEDLKRGKLRAVGDAYARLYEDTLRLVRFLRFSITKNLCIVGPDWEVIYNFPAEMLSQIDADRRREELVKMFKHDTHKSIHMLMSLPNETQKHMFYNPKGADIWLLPNTKER